MTIFLIVCALLFIVLMGVLAAGHDQEKDKKKEELPSRETRFHPRFLGNNHHHWRSEFLQIYDR